MVKEYTLEDFNFSLPKRLIAQVPSNPRDHARLLVYNRANKFLIDDYFYNIEKYLPVNSTIVINNSKVEKCRMLFEDAEIFVLETINPTTVRALVRPGKKFRIGSTKIDGFKFAVDGIDESGIRTIRLDRPLDDKSFDAHKLTPLPPYIAQDESLASEYQTVYADPLGSKAAPTAGLHFTSQLLENIRAKHRIAEVTLHVGMGTFAPVKTKIISSHLMHAEEYFISANAAKILGEAVHITAVGTTSVRVLESAKLPFVKQHGTTSIFITPGYHFSSVGSLITNFHLPKSTLLMLVASFMGSVEELHRTYEYAIEKGYKFYSFGDAMIIL
ncbi:tRNA preQ1(34) S-adenosylmethionine ribosyltransferase-isomerase QueA [soil metagenome]